MLRLLRTTAFRFALIYVVFFTIAVMLIAAYVYESTFGVVSRQTDETLVAEVEGLVEQHELRGLWGLRKVIEERVSRRSDAIYLLISPLGERLAGNLASLPEAALANPDGFDFLYQRPVMRGDGEPPRIENRGARGVLVRFKTSGYGREYAALLVARDIGEREELQRRLRAVVFRAALAVIVLGLAIGLVFGRSLLMRVDQVSRTAAKIRDGDLGQRIPVHGGGDELDNLAINLNAMLDQIERLMNGMRQVSDNIAHDLRSPLTRIRNRIEAALADPNADQRAALDETMADADRLLATFNALLSIARVESGEGAGVRARVDIGAVAEEIAELYEPAAQEAGFELSCTTAAGLEARGSRELIAQAAANLLDNALKHAKGGTRIELRAERGPAGAVRLTVCDDGPGVAPEDREKVLGRFVRLEASRTTPGSGLGLSLVAAVARAHGARLTLTDGLGGAAGPGLCACVDFPAAGEKSD